MLYTDDTAPSGGNKVEDQKKEDGDKTETMPSLRPQATWADRERVLREILAPLGKERLERELKLHKESFEGDVASDPGQEDRLTALEAVLRPKTPQQRERFLELLGRNST